MPDSTLPIAGSDSRLELLLDGVPQNLTVSVVRASARARYDTIETKVLGTDNVDIDKRPTGWEGELEIVQRDGTLDDFIDAINLARRSSPPVPVLINFVHTKIFRNKTSRTHVYPDVKVEFGSDTQRGQADTIRIPWITGVDRV